MRPGALGHSVPKALSDKRGCRSIAAIPYPHERMALMLMVEEVWMDLAEDSKSARIRMSVKPGAASAVGLFEGKPIYTRLAGPDGLIGCVRVRYVAFIKDLVIAEVDQILPADDQCQHVAPSQLILSGHRQAGL